jgi:hypothetical protein
MVEYIVFRCLVCAGYYRTITEAKRHAIKHFHTSAAWRTRFKVVRVSDDYRKTMGKEGNDNVSLNAGK